MLNADENSCSAFFRSPFCRKAQPRSSPRAAGLFANAEGTAGTTKSGNLSVVTAGVGGAIFGAQEAPTQATARMNLRITAILLRPRAQEAEESPRHVGDDRQLPVAFLVYQHAAVTIQTGDALAVHGVARIESQR